MKEIQKLIKTDKTRHGEKLRYFKVQIDAQKAFDSVRRDKIAEVMHKLEINPIIINAISNTLTGTGMEVNEDKFQTFMGTP